MRASAPPGEWPRPRSGSSRPCGTPWTRRSQEQATPELEETEKISMGEISVREAHMLVQ